MSTRSEHGSSVVEAALLVAVIAAVLTGTLMMVGHSLSVSLGGALTTVGL